MKLFINIKDKKVIERIKTEEDSLKEFHNRTKKWRVDKYPKYKVIESLINKLINFEEDK